MHRTEIRVQWFDTDRENIVYFGNYFRFFTTAEDEILRSIGITHNDLKKKFNIGFTRVEAQCRYKRPATYGDLIEVQTGVKLENHNFFLTFEFCVFRKEGQILLAEGSVRTACVRLGKEFKIVRIPEEVLARFKQVINEGNKKTS